MILFSCNLHQWKCGTVKLKDMLFILTSGSIGARACTDSDQFTLPLAWRILHHRCKKCVWLWCSTKSSLCSDYYLYVNNQLMEHSWYYGTTPFVLASYIILGYPHLVPVHTELDMLTIVFLQLSKCHLSDQNRE